MHSTLSKTKALFATLLVLSLILVGCTASAPEAKITLNPTTVESSMKEMIISGSGFTPNSTVSGGIPDLRPQRKTNLEAEGIYFLIATTDDKGDFEVKIRLANGLFNVIRTKQYTEQELVGTHTVIAEDDKGLKAETTLTITLAPTK